MISFYIIIIFISFIFTWLYRIYAIKKSFIDIPNNRSSHDVPVPRGGGVAVGLSWYAGLCYLFFLGEIDVPLFYAFLSGLPLSLIGFTDDLFSLKPGVRFFVHFFCTALALWFLGGLLNFQICGDSFDLPILLTFLAFISIIWSINLFNFLDGIDGYIGTEIIFIGISIFVLSGNILGILLALSVGGFLIWNWPKAKIFMGDVGSTLLGFIVAVSAVYFQNVQQLSLVVFLILTSVFWFDATITLLRRIQNKEKISEAHRKHAYQRAVQSGYTHQQTTLGSCFLNFIGFGLAWLAHHYSTYDVMFLLFDLLILYGVLKYIDKRKPFEYRTS